MKKLMVVFSLAILVTFVVTSNIMAYPFIEVEGHVNPKAGNVDTDFLTGITKFEKVDYAFTVTDAGNGGVMNLLKIEFERDVFVNAGTLAYKNPANWNTDITYNSSGSFNQIAFGTPLGKGDSFTFSMLDMVLVNDALTSSDLWQEGNIWGQSFGALGLANGFIPVIDGGSTTPTPEPGTFLMLGSGLVGVVLYVRKKKCLLSI